VKQTVFASLHQQKGARMVDFAGFYMPLDYSGVTDEHMTVRNKVGVFDVSHMGEIWVKGANATRFLQWVTSNDVTKLYPGKAQYSCLPNGKGGIVDDILVYMFDEQKYLVVVNASNIEKDWNWLNSQNKFEAELENSSDNISQLAIQGPLAIKVLQKLTKVDLSSISYYAFTTGEFAGCANVIISNTGYTGAGGFELYFYNSDAEKIWNAVFEAGNEEGIKPAGLACRDTLRLEMGFCLYGNDIDDTTSPLEAGLGWITKFTDSKDFIDKAFLLDQKNKGIERQLVGFELIDKGVPRHGYNICDKNGNIIGIVTSGTMSPVLKLGIGMGYVKTPNNALDSEIYISIREKLIKAKVVKTPFIKK
jgi:aminomethyltransferase